jgi:non-specific serine/threonine protein kinase
MIRGEHDRALQLFEQAVASLRERGEAWGLGIALSIVAGLRLVRRELDLAQTHALQAMALCEELEDPRGIAWCLDLFAALLASGGDPQAGGQLWGAADALLERLGGSLAPTVAWIRERHLGVARTSLGNAAFDAAHAEGRAISPEQAIALARRRARQAAGSLRLVQAEESREQSGS